MPRALGFKTSGFNDIWPSFQLWNSLSWKREVLVLEYEWWVGGMTYSKHSLKASMAGMEGKSNCTDREKTRDRLYRTSWTTVRAFLPVTRETIRSFEQRGTWVAQSIKRPTLEFGSGQDPTVVGWSPHQALPWVWSLLEILYLSLYHCSSLPLLMLSPSFSVSL